MSEPQPSQSDVVWDFMRKTGRVGEDRPMSQAFFDTCQPMPPDFEFVREEKHAAIFGRREGESSVVVRRIA